MQMPSPPLISTHIRSLPPSARTHTHTHTHTHSEALADDPDFTCSFYLENHTFAFKPSVFITDIPLQDVIVRDARHISPHTGNNAA